MDHAPTDLSTSLSRVLSDTADKMRADFKRSSEVDHRGEKGSIRERLLIKDFLRDYLPGTVEVSGSCEIVDVTGARSPQVDIAIYDPSAPPLYRQEDFRLFPSECIYGTIEVKSNLTGPELRTCVANARKVKQLQKSEYEWHLSTRTRQQYGAEWSHCPTVSFVFAYDSVDLATLAEVFAEECRTIPIEERIDAVWVLGKGALNWHDPIGPTINPSPLPGGRIAVGDVHGDQDILLSMILLLNIHFGTAWMPPFILKSYAGQAPLATTRGVWDVEQP